MKACWNEAWESEAHDDAADQSKSVDLVVGLESALLFWCCSAAEHKTKEKSEHATEQESSHTEASIDNEKLVENWAVDFVKERSDPWKEEDLKEIDSAEQGCKCAEHGDAGSYGIVERGSGVISPSESEIVRWEESNFVVSEIVERCSHRWEREPSFVPEASENEPVLKSEYRDQDGKCHVNGWGEGDIGRC